MINEKFEVVFHFVIKESLVEIIVLLQLLKLSKGAHIP